MRVKIATWLFILGGIAWLVMAGVMIASGAGLLVWVVWALSAPAWILACMLAVGSRKPEPSTTVTTTINNPVPQYGAMRKDEE